jgi:5-methylcytosine-specific restriction endonuclease McrA
MKTLKRWTVENFFWKKVNHNRLKVFQLKGFDCVKCGLKGKFVEVNRLKDGSIHIDLFGENEEGKKVLMTVDHIIPLSKGGKNTLENKQPMCVECNQTKGDKV